MEVTRLNRQRDEARRGRRVMSSKGKVGTRVAQSGAFVTVATKAIPSKTKLPSINWANDFTIYETISELKNEIAATYIQLTYLEEKKAKIDTQKVNELMQKGIKMKSLAIENLYFASETEGREYIENLKNEFLQVKHLYDVTNSALK